MFAVRAMAETLCTWLRTSLEISVLRLLFGCIWKDSYINGSKQSLTQFPMKKRNQLVGQVFSFSPSYNLGFCSWIFAVLQNKKVKKI